jgi:sugar phosphate isomerase/epimerase
VTIHLKEYSKTSPKALLGEGDVPWDKVFRLCEKVGGTKWYIVEYEVPGVPPLECVAKCLKNLRDMGK